MSSDFQIIVIGAGAAGLMAAGRAAERGARVLLLEKMNRPGSKILITGNGHCNLTNSCDKDTFLDKFGPGGRFLQNVFGRYFRDELLTLLERLGVDHRTEPGGRVYPVTNKARDVVRAFNRYLASGNAEVKYEASVTDILHENGAVTGVRTEKGDLYADAVILAAGGSCHPQTGSTGDGYRMAEKLGHTIVRLRPALVPLVVSDTDLAKRMQGSSLQGVRITAFQCRARDIDVSLTPATDVGSDRHSKRPKPPVISSYRGDSVITHFGLGGPLILEMSLGIVDALESGPVSVSIDLFPDTDRADLRRKLQSSFETYSKRTCQNIMKAYISPRMLEPLLELADVEPSKEGGQINSKERERLLDQMKSLRFDITKAHSMATAIVTAGGISLKEINPATMESKLVKGLYVCGEVMDVQAGTGGYNLQAAFSTGYLAGESAASAVLTRP